MMDYKSDKDWMDKILVDINNGETRITFEYQDIIYPLDIITLFREHSTLDYLSLDGNNLGDEGALVISEVLRINTGLQEFSLYNNAIRDKGAMGIASALGVNTTLTHIHLGSNQIGDAGAAALSDTIKEHQTLKELGLSENHIGDAGAMTISDALNTNTVLETLYFSNNPVGDIGITAISEALKLNSTLKFLYLDYNNIGDNGASAIADGLKLNSCLQELLLVGNRISDNGARSIGEALAVNTTLRALFITGNKIDVEGVLAIADGLKRGGYKEVHIGEQDVEGTYMNTLETGQAVDISLIGEGNYGAAYRCMVDSRSCVAKVAHDKLSADSLYETLFLQCLPKHSNIIELIGVNPYFQIEEDDEDDYLEQEEHAALILPFHEKGSLKSFVANHNGDLDLIVLLKYSVGMSRGIDHLHKYGIIHRDIALRNFVLSDENDTILIDFGLSCFVGEGKVKGSDESFPWRWSSPESLSNNEFSRSSDIWMLGITLWQLLKIIDTPFHQFRSFLQLRDVFNEMRDSKKCVPLIFKMATPPEYRNLIEMCCQFEPSKRPTADELVSGIETMIMDLSNDCSNGDSEKKILDSDEKEIKADSNCLPEYVFDDEMYIFNPSDNDTVGDYRDIYGCYVDLPDETGTYVTLDELVEQEA